MLSPTVSTPATPTPAEKIAEALERIGPLNGLPLEDRLWLARHGEEFVANSGDVLFEEGAAAENMILILKGEIHVRRQHGGPMALFIGRAGQMTGVLPFSRMKTYGGQGFAISPVWALIISKSIFPEMLQAIPSMAQRVVATLLDRVREVTRIEQQAEKLTALGKLAGNLAHELNNPASAAQSASASLASALTANRENRFKLVKFLGDSFDAGGGVLLFQPGINDVGLAAFGQLAGDERPDFGQAGRLAHERLDASAPGRPLGNDGNVQVAVQGESEGARNGGGGHDQQVRIGALAHQLLALGHSELVLFVNNNKTQLFRRERVLQQGVGADEETARARAKGRQ